MWALSTCGEPDDIKKSTHPQNITAFALGQVATPGPFEHTGNATGADASKTLSVLGVANTGEGVSMALQGIAKL